MRRDRYWLALLALLATGCSVSCSSIWTAGAGAAGPPCVSDHDSLRTRDSSGVCRATGRTP